MCPPRARRSRVLCAGVKSASCAAARHPIGSGTLVRRGEGLGEFSNPSSTLREGFANARSLLRWMSLRSWRNRKQTKELDEQLWNCISWFHCRFQFLLCPALLAKECGALRLSHNIRLFCSGQLQADRLSTWRSRRQRVVWSTQPLLEPEETACVVCQ